MSHNIHIKNTDEILKTLELLYPRERIFGMLQITRPTYLRWRSARKIPQKYADNLRKALDEVERSIIGTWLSLNRKTFQIKNLNDSVDGWLADQLKDGPKLKRDIVRKSKFTNQQLYHAGIRLGMKSKTKGFGSKARATWWIP